MRRKNRKWVAMAAAAYLFVVWSAYRWGIAQRPTDGNIFDHIDGNDGRNVASESVSCGIVESISECGIVAYKFGARGSCARSAFRGCRLVIGNA